MYIIKFFFFPLAVRCTVKYQWYRENFPTMFKWTTREERTQFSQLLISGLVHCVTVHWIRSSTTTFSLLSSSLSPPPREKWFQKKRGRICL